MRKKRFRSRDIPPKDKREAFIIAKEKLVDGGFVFGWDPPTTKNLGWAVMRYKDGKGHYIKSGLEIMPADDLERLIYIYEFVNNLKKQYNPVIASLMERAIGFGNAPAREKLGENTGIIKFASIMIGAEVKPIHTISMGCIFANTGGMARVDKKTATQKKAKEYFPISLADRRVTQTGNFTHEADAIGFCVGFFISNGIDIAREEKKENE